MTKFLVVLALLIKLNLSFGQKDLAKVFSELESFSDFTFNYEKDSLSLYFYDGEIPNQIDEKFITHILQSTPFHYQVTNRNEVLIYKSLPTMYTICGTIKDKLDDQILPYGNIKISNSVTGTESDDNGFFSFTHQGLKDDIVSISYIGYKSKDFRVSWFESEPCPIIILETDENILTDKVVIKGYILRDITKTKEYGSFHFNYENFTQRKSSLESDVLRSLQFLPGVSSTDDSATNLNIRGASADHSIVLWENAPLYNPGHMFGMISAINPYVVNQVNLYKDIFHPKYDNRVGSLIDISLNDKPSENLSIGAGLTLTEGHFFLESPIVKNHLSIILSGRKSIYDLFQSQTFSSYSETIFQNTKIEENQAEIEEGERTAENELSFHDLNAKVNFKPNAKINISGSYFKSRNRFSYSSEEFFDGLTSDDLVDYKVDIVSGIAQMNWNTQHSTTTEYTNSITENELEFSIVNMDEEDPLVYSFGSNNINDESVKIDHKYRTSNGINFGLGYSYNIKEVGFALTEIAEFEEDINEQEKTSGKFHNLFMTVDGIIGNLNFNTGLKMTNPLGNNQYFISPRISIQYKLSNAFSIILATGRTFQFINQLEEFGGFDLNLNGNIWILKDIEDDEILEAKKVSLGALYKKDGWLFDVSGYRNVLSGLSLLQSSSIGIDPEDFDDGQSTSVGIDLLINKNWSLIKKANVQSWLTYSWNQNDYFFPNISSLTFPATIQQKHILKLVNKINYKNFQLMCSYHFKSGLPYSLPNGIIPSEIDEDEFQINYESINGNQLSHYHRLDLGLTYQHKSESINFEVSTSVLNLLDHTNIFSRSSFIDENEREEQIIISSEKRLLKRTPLLMVRFFW
tara:strand:- start:1712 stop:4285 length:2574 start_codon:yes stop_codon:yes gene_type:complete